MQIRNENSYTPYEEFEALINKLENWDKKYVESRGNVKGV